MLRTGVRLAVQILRFINLFFKPLPMRDRVVIISRQSDEPTLDIQLLDDGLKRNGIETVVLMKTFKKGFVEAVSLCLQMMRQMYYIATSKVVVIDGYCILVSVLPKKKNQKVIQMWHALGAIKKFGWQNTDNPDGRDRAFAEAMCMHRNYDYVLAPGAITGKIFAEAFRIPESRIVYYGLPRIDFICKKDATVRREMETMYPKIREKENVLYVPTFRKNAVLSLENLVRGFDFERFNLIIKKHFLDKGDYSWAEKKGAVIDHTYSSMEWLRVCTKVITDYSAIAFEAAVLDRELYIFQPDAADYAKRVGLNVDLSSEAIGKYVCRSESALFKVLAEPYQRNAVEAFRKKYIEIDPDNCTQKLCGFIFKLLAE